MLVTQMEPQGEVRFEDTTATTPTLKNTTTKKTILKGPTLLS